MVTVTDATTVKVAAVDILFHARDEINLPDIEMGVVSVQADEMTFETTTEPVTDFRLGKSKVEFHVIGKFPGIITTVQNKSEITP